MQTAVQISKTTKLRKAAIQAELQTIKKHRDRLEEKKKFDHLLELARAGADDPYTAMKMKEYVALPSKRYLHSISSDIESSNRS